MASSVSFRFSHLRAIPVGPMHRGASYCSSWRRRISARRGAIQRCERVAGAPRYGSVARSAPFPGADNSRHFQTLPVISAHELESRAGARATALHGQRRCAPASREGEPPLDVRSRRAIDCPQQTERARHGEPVVAQPDIQRAGDRCDAGGRGGGEPSPTRAVWAATSRPGCLPLSRGLASRSVASGGVRQSGSWLMRAAIHVRWYRGEHPRPELGGGVVV
jgi:hypothetical protein